MQKLPLTKRPYSSALLQTTTAKHSKLIVDAYVYVSTHDTYTQSSPSDSLLQQHPISVEHSSDEVDLPIIQKGIQTTDNTHLVYKILNYHTAIISCLHYLTHPLTKYQRYPGWL